MRIRTCHLPPSLLPRRGGGGEENREAFEDKGEEEITDTLIKTTVYKTDLTESNAHRGPSLHKTKRAILLCRTLS
jgi:hypothetical protein